MRFLSSCAFRGKGAAPQRSRVDPIGIEGEHPVVEVACRCGLAVHPIEIADISARRVDVAGAAIPGGGGMAYDDCPPVDPGGAAGGPGPRPPARPVRPPQERLRFVLKNASLPTEGKTPGM